MGLYNVQDSEPLQTWLIRNLDAISDADPTALAKYILELLNMWTNDPETQVKSRLGEELEDFLQGEATPFVDRLLAALRSKSYLPYSTMADAPQSFNRQQRGRKRSLEQDEHEMSRERDLKGPPKGPRTHSDRGTRRIPDAPRNHHQRTNGREPGHFRERGNGPPIPNGSNFVPPGGMGPPNQRERCNDYYNFGVCNRGAACPYSHGDDAMVSNGLPFVPPIPPAMALQMLNGFFPPAWQAGFMGPPNGPPAPYEPLYGHTGGPPQPMQGSGNDPVVQDLTPREPRSHREGQFQPSANPVSEGVDSTAMEDVHPSEDIPPQPDRRTNHDNPAHNGRSFRGRGGRGGRPEKINRSSVVDPNSVTIVVEKLPPEKTNIQDLTTYFSRFGSVTNVAIDHRGNRALVSFSTHQEAHAAWKSEEAVFGNRFVVIFWHRPAPGGGAAGQKALEASATAIQKINAGATGVNEDTVMADNDSTQRKVDLNPAITNGFTRKPVPKSPQEIYEYASRVWMEKMKGIMNILQSTTASESEKQDAKAKFNVLKAQKPVPPKIADPLPVKKKEGLDLDLDMLANGQGQPLTQEEAQETIAKLQALAAEQGLDPNELEEDETRSSHHTFGGYRGRGRGRGWRGGYRGRGRGAGVAMANASLDNRSKQISLRGYDKDSVSDDNALGIIQNYYLPTGQVESVEKGEPGEVIISYPTRASAETAVRSGVPHIEGLSDLSMQWHNPAKSKVNGEHTPVPSANTPVPSANTPVSSAIKIDKDAESHAESWGAKRVVRGGDDDDDGHEGWGA